MYLNDQIINIDCFYGTSQNICENAGLASKIKAVKDTDQ